MHLTFLSPRHELFAGEVSEVRIPGEVAPFQVLHGHAPLVSVLTPGKVAFTAQSSGQVFSFNIIHGIAQVEKDAVVVLAELSE